MTTITAPAPVLPAYPASPAQVKFINTLLAEREVDAIVKDIVSSLIANGAMPKSNASQFIEQLLTYPKVKVEMVDLAPGYYTLDEKVYKVQVSKSSGKPYAKVLVLPTVQGKKGTWDYAPGAYVKLASQGAVAVTLEQAKDHGHNHGWCMICGAHLTDPKSVDAGIGPVCASKF